MGLLTSLATAGLERHRSTSTSSQEGAPRLGRRMSMEEYDTPNIARLALASKRDTDDEADNNGDAPADKE